jgi:hypothetical protein
MPEVKLKAFLQHSVLGLCFFLLVNACAVPIDIDLLAQVELINRFSDNGQGSFSIEAAVERLDLLPYLADFSAQSLSIPIPIAGISLALDLALPTSQGLGFSFADQSLPVDLTEASFHYQITLSRSGGLGGLVLIQPYLAPAGNSMMAQPSFALGDAQLYDLDTSSVTLSSSGLLSSEQLDAINDKSLRFMLAVSGNLTAVATGNASLGYDISTLALDISGVGVNLDEMLPSADGELINFSDETFADKSRVKSLGLDYTVVLSHNSQLDGKVQVQLYVAPAGDDALFVDNYRFGAQKTFDLSQSSATISETAFLNASQFDLLEDQSMRVGATIRGVAEAPLGQTITLDYEFTKLLLKLSTKLF